MTEEDTFYDKLARSDVGNRGDPVVDINTWIGQPWEFQPWESAKAFAAFSIYLNMSAKTRNLADAFRIGTGKDKTHKATGHYIRWYQRNQWRKRARAWDTYRAQQEREVELEEVRKEAKFRSQAFGTLMRAAMTIVSKSELQKLEMERARSMLGLVTSFMAVGAGGQRLELGQPQQDVNVNLTNNPNHGEITLETLANIAAKGPGLFRFPPELDVEAYDAMLEGPVSGRNGDTDDGDDSSDGA